MMIELSVYGGVTGLMMKVHTGRYSADLYISMVAAMLCGRLVAGILWALIFFDGVYTIGIWATSYFVTSLPGIIIQMAFLPSLVMALERERIIPLRYPVRVNSEAVPSF